MARGEGEGETVVGSTGNPEVRGADDVVGKVSTAWDRAVRSWREAGNPRPLQSWLSAELDEQGFPKRWPVALWWPAISGLVPEGKASIPPFPEEVADRLADFVRSALRFTRPDGSAAFGAEGPIDVDRVVRLLKRLPEPGLQTVFERWSLAAPRRRGEHASPPLPAASAEKSPLAILRADWSPRGDFVAIDDRDLSGACRLEVFGQGRRLLGPAWAFGESPIDRGRARLSRWSTDSKADLAEWTFRAGQARVTRTALFLRGRSLALLADEVAGPESFAASRIDVAPGWSARSEPELRSLLLKPEIGAGSCRVIPLALPALPYPTERGSLVAEAGSLLLRHRLERRRAWLPWLLSWDPTRNRKTVHWRVLTVVEKSKICPSNVAFAARVGWGRGEGLVVYRSFARPVLRSFLGHQTTARFFVGLFDADGDVEPLLSVES